MSKALQEWDEMIKALRARRWVNRITIAAFVIGLIWILVTHIVNRWFQAGGFTLINSFG